MKAIVLCCIFLGLSTAWAQKTPTSSVLRFPTSAWDFGTIQEQAGSVTHTFTFTNTARTPVVIEQVATSCGCTTPTYSREPILPNATGRIEVAYDPTNRPGPFRKEITVTSDNRRSQNKLIITGNVEGRERTPQEEYPSQVGAGLRVERLVAGLGYVPRGASRSITIPYYNDLPTALTLGVEYEQPSPLFRVSFAPERIPARGKGLMTLTYDLTQTPTWGRLHNPYYVTLNGKRAPERFDVSGIAVEDFSSLTAQQRKEAPKAIFSTQYYHFKEQRIGQTLSHEFTLANAGLTPLIVRYVSQDPYIKCSLRVGTKIEPGNELPFTLTLQTGALPRGNSMESALIIVNDPDRPMRELRLAATLIP